MTGPVSPSATSNIIRINRMHQTCVLLLKNEDAPNRSAVCGKEEETGRISSEIPLLWHDGAKFILLLSYPLSVAALFSPLSPFAVSRPWEEHTIFLRLKVSITKLQLSPHVAKTAIFFATWRCTCITRCYIFTFCKAPISPPFYSILWFVSRFNAQHFSYHAAFFLEPMKSKASSSSSSYRKNNSERGVSATKSKTRD